MSTSSLQHREPVRVELREVEDVADEALEPPRLGLDDLERVRRAARDPRRRPRAAPRRGRGSRSAACAARARPTSGSSARASRPRRAASAISLEPLGEVPDLAGAALRDLDVVVAAPRPRRRRARARARAATIAASRYHASSAGDEQAERAGDREPLHERRARGGRRRSSASRRRSRRSACPPSDDRLRRPRGRCGSAPGGVNSNVSVSPETSSRSSAGRAAAGPDFSPGNGLARRRSRSGRRSRARGSRAANVGARRESSSCRTSP